MEPETLVPSVLPSGDQLLAEVRAVSAPPKRADAKPVRVELTLDQASFLWERLERLTAEGRLTRKAAFREVITLPPALLEKLWLKLDELSATGPFRQSKNGPVQLLERTIALDLKPHEARYLLTILKNEKRSKWRREKVEHGLFAPLQVAEMAEDGGDLGELSDGVRRRVLKSGDQENPDARLRRDLIERALDELPSRLKMRRDSVRKLLTALLDADGNVSEAARLTGQPQRKTARRIQRILTHLKDRGLAA